MAKKKSRTKKKPVKKRSAKKKQPIKKAKRKIPWDEIRNQYICDPSEPAYTELARIYKVHFQTIRNRSIKEEWNELRKQHSKNNIKTVSNELAKKQVYNAQGRIVVVENLLTRILEEISDREKCPESKSLEGMMREAREMVRQLEVFAGGVTDRIALTAEQSMIQRDLLDWLEREHPDKYKKIVESFGIKEGETIEGEIIE